ncbi:reverse transcriptase domain-containing protein [Tanacetum coccineum]
MPPKFIQFVKSLKFGALTSWGVPSSKRENIFLVAVDYCQNWLKQKRSHRCSSGSVVCKFLKSLFARFGAPRAIISDRGTHFCNDQFAKVMLKYGVTHRLSRLSPQTSGKLEVSHIVD